VRGFLSFASLLVIVGCRGGADKPPPPAPTPAVVADAGGPTCAPLPFASESPIPEASAAAFLVVDGALALVVIGDSGNHGAYELLDPDDGHVREHGALPLGDTTDDLEGLAVRGDRVYGLTSPGWIYAWTRQDHGFALVEGPYPLGPVDATLPLKGGMGDKPPKGDGMVCGAHGVNCGRNYEGLCLAARPRGGLVGFAAAKADGHLYGLREVDGKLVVDRAAAIAIARPGVVADCAFADDDTLWVGSNLFDLGNVYRVDGWEAPATAQVVRLEALGLGFPEGLAVRGDVFYRFSDAGGAPSLMAKFRCRRTAR
jgi:hypothetical protein